MDTNLRVRHSAESPKPSEAEVVSAILEIENATQKASAAGGSLPEAQAAPPSLVLSLKMLLLCFVLVMMVASLLAWGVYRMAKGFLLPVAGRGSVDGTRAHHLATDAMKQAEAELLLARVAAGDSGAASQVLEQSASWTGKTESTPKTDQFITTSLNLHDLKSRGAALEAQLALNGIPRD
ncbi:MAG TPA: hypothetical protein VMO17_21385, partial [Terriglobia bacterium]|nr:hypothetical protein [Terriglobia bacterium]